MDHSEILTGKKILAVDDEPDILFILEEMLAMCQVDKAYSFEEAASLLDGNLYDAAILDIMGVKGYQLLAITQEKDIPTLMLTAHALTPDNLKKAIELGADAYIPKELISNIAMYLSETLLARKENKKAHATWFSLLKPFFDRLFGEGWRKKDQKFWDGFDNKQISSRDDIQKMK